MKEHLGYAKHSRSETENNRNRGISKMLITEQGTVNIDVPSDRDSSFEPSIVKKRQNRIE